MLWYKGWLETRGKALFALMYAVFPVLFLPLTARNLAPASHPAMPALQHTIGFLGFYWAAFGPPMLLAGSGIKTQTLRAQRGVHSSMLYTLSLPVSRLRLFLTRAGLGFGELAAVLLIAPLGILVIFPTIRPNVTPRDLFEYWISALACGIFFCSVGVLFSTFLDDLTQNWSSMAASIFFWWALTNSHVPAPLDIFNVIGANAPLFTHSLPWAPMGVAIAAAAILCTAALMIVRVREY
jgi:hypothetical protein